MFETMSDYQVAGYMGEATRMESMSIAQRLAAVAELFVRYSGPLADLEWCVADCCSVVAAEVAAVQRISHSRAVSQVQFACALWHRLPSVAKVFLRGTIDYRLVATVISRTENVDKAVMPALDEALARRVEKWMKLSMPKLRDRIDKFVAEFDPLGQRVPPRVRDNRYVEVEPSNIGMASISGYVTAADGAALDQRLDAIAATVCDKDPRTHEQRRADALGAIGRWESSLVCECGLDDCPAAARRDEANAAAAVVIHVLAEQSTLERESDRPGYLEGFGVMPAESVRDLAADGARITPVPLPTGQADRGYRPSAKTKQFLRWRDLTCRAPGCDRPVAAADVDHTVAWPFGPTHPSNNKHYCRIHHLLKTFCGFLDRQLSDGTIEWTTPSGHTYTTEPHGAALFPVLGESTGELDLPTPEADPTVNRLAKMPRRSQTRAQARQQRINAERRQRAELISEQQRQEQAWLAETYEPPPF